MREKKPGENERRGKYLVVKRPRGKGPGWKSSGWKSPGLKTPRGGGKTSKGEKTGGEQTRLVKTVGKRPMAKESITASLPSISVRYFTT